ncbi:MAG TPA: HDOD domain-containing protein, partial [Fibrobacteraceae bacterium]|nr:HDOD domain-containing protein [Fibrobacteraceae bacterium]
MPRNERFEQMTRNLGELPTLPVIIQKINALLSNPRTTATEIGQAISSDQAIAAKIIRLVNSALYGFPGRISTITHAIVILGFSTVKNVILT